MSLDNAVKKAVSNVPECVAGGYVDLTSGMILAMTTLDSHPAQVIDLVAAATADLFQGQNVMMIETLFNQARGIKDNGHHYFQEILVNSDNLIHIFMRGKRYSEHVMVFVCRRTANLGMALTKARMQMPEIEASV